MNLVLLNNMDPEFKKLILKFKKTARDGGIQEGSKLKYPSPLIVKQYAKDLISVLNSIKKDSIEIECCFEDLEDFIVSNNLLPLGSLCYVLFCTSKYGWGFKNFLKEANCGEGISFPKQVGFYVSYIIPVIILVIFIQGYISKFL